jgi:Kef-type K+ transport system membrane component KefB
LLIAGLLQVPITVAAGWALFFGLGSLGLAGLEGYAAFYLALACGFSSTLLVVKALQEHLRLDTRAGQLAIGLLIFQDIWAIMILAVQPSFASPEVGPILQTFLGIGIIGGLAAGFARWVLPAAFRAVAKVPELVVTVALGWCFGLGMLGAHLGTITHAVGLGVDPSISLEMGALIAGTSIATFPYAYDVVGKVSHLRDFFVTLFFVALGMSIPWPDGIDVLITAAVLSVVCVLLRAVVFLPLLRITGLDRRTSSETSAILAQISEFSLVMAYLGVGLGHLTERTTSIVIFAFVITALITPALFKLADRIGTGPAAGGPVGGHEKPRLVLLGFHRLGSALLHDLGRLHADVLPDTLVVDFNVANHDAIRKTGARVAYGDLASPETLAHVGVKDAEIVVSTVPDALLRGTTNLDLVRAVRKLAPNAMILAQASTSSEVTGLRAAGADYVFTWQVEASLSLLPAIYAGLNGTLAEWLEARRLEHGKLAERNEVLR